MRAARSRASVSRAYRRGGVLRRPRYPSRGFSKVGGVYLPWLTPSHTPPLCSPHGGAPRRRPRGQPRAASPSRLLLAGDGEKNMRGYYQPLLFARLRSPPRYTGRLRSRLTLLALPPSPRLWRDKPVAQRPRTPRAFLRRFKPTAQSRSHAGCALAGYPLAFGVCAQRMRWVISVTANERMSIRSPAFASASALNALPAGRALRIAVRDR